MKEKKLKILYISNLLATHDRKFLKKLASIYDVYLVSFKNEAIALDIKNIQGLKIHHLPVENFIFTRMDNLFSKFFKYLRHKVDESRKQKYLKSILKQVKPDIIHAMWVQDAGFLAALTGFHPFVLMPWGSDILISPYINKEQMKITKYVLERADKIVCDCETVKNKAIEILKGIERKVVIFPWGVDLKVFKPRNSKGEILKGLNWIDKKIVVSTRTFEQIYGINYIIEAAARVLKENQDARFIFCCYGSEMQNMINLADQLNIRQYVHFTGLLEPEDVPFYLNAADVYVSASLSDGTSISLLEALGCGLPVVVTDVPSNFEWVKENEGGFIVPKKDSNALADKIIMLLKDENLRKNMGVLNRKVVSERADWDKNFEIVKKVYEELCG